MSAAADTKSGASAAPAASRPACIVNEKDVAVNSYAARVHLPQWALPEVLTKAKCYTGRWRSLAAAAGGVQLGCTLYEIPAGGVATPYHYHDSNEEAMYVLSGAGTVRCGNAFVQIAKGDYAVFPAGGTAADAHQTTNTSEWPLKYLCFSTNKLPEVVTYPDSQKVGVRTERGGFRLFPLAAEVPYWSGEPVPPANAAAAAGITPAAAMKAEPKPATASTAAAASGTADAKTGTAARPKWVLNENELTPTTWADMRKPMFEMPQAVAESYAFTRWRFGPLNLAGAKQLGCSIYSVPAGKTGWTYHYHDINEEAIYILSGSGTLRLGGQFVPVSSGDYISLKPCTDGSAAHQLINSSGGELRYLCISTMRAPEMTTYPDSKKVGVITETTFALYPNESSVPYFFRESAPPAVPK